MLWRGGSLWRGVSRRRWGGEGWMVLVGLYAAVYDYGGFWTQRGFFYGAQSDFL